MKPLKDLIVIKLDEKPTERKSSAGLFLPQEKWEKPRNIATVVEVGPDVNKGVQSTAVMITEGKRVVFNPYAVLDTDEENTKLIREKDLLCLITN